MSDFMSEKTELFPFTHHVSIGPLIIDNSKKPTLLPPMEIQNEVSTLRAQVQQLTEENERLTGACNKEFESVQTLDNECQKLRADLKRVEEERDDARKDAQYSRRERDGLAANLDSLSCLLNRLVGATEDTLNSHPETSCCAVTKQYCKEARDILSEPPATSLTALLDQKKQEWQAAAFNYMLGICANRRVLNRTQDYLVAVDEIETFIKASIDRLNAGEQMGATAVAQSDPSPKPDVAHPK